MMGIRWTALILFFAVVSVAGAAEDQATVHEDRTRVDQWNRFAARLYEVHRERMAGRQIRTETKEGGYGGDFSKGFHYVETSYFDRESGRLLARIRRNKAKPDILHTIEENFYDAKGRVIRDYTAAWLPRFHNAPYQTLIDLHVYNGKLHAFRQFDASGEIIFEKCEGSYSGKAVNMSLEDYEIPTNQMEMSGVYLACFSGLPSVAGKWLDPRSELPARQRSSRSDLDPGQQLAKLNAQLKREPRNGKLYIRRGDLLFAQHEFDRAVVDYDRAIRLNPKLDQAWFGRGMALGRAGKLDRAIADLTVFVQRNPESSVGFTKRGIRRVWNGDLKQARRDLERAIELDPGNSEAHDDLGVLFARDHEYALAMQHFRKAIRHDASYAKAYHNLATTYYLKGNPKESLTWVEGALALDPENRNSLLLKSEALLALGREDEARIIRDEAEQLPQGNWTERLGVQ
jgi:tetratricopeptide (TPR) repeat protein